MPKIRIKYMPLLFGGLRPREQDLQEHEIHVRSAEELRNLPDDQLMLLDATDTLFVDGYETKDEDYSIEWEVVEE